MIGNIIGWAVIVFGGFFMILNFKDMSHDGVKLSVLFAILGMLVLIYNKL